MVHRGCALILHLMTEGGNVAPQKSKPQISCVYDSYPFQGNK